MSEGGQLQAAGSGKNIDWAGGLSSSFPPPTVLLLLQPRKGGSLASKAERLPNQNVG